MQTFTLIYSTFAGKGAQTIIRANSGREAWAFLMTIPDLNPRRKAGAFPRPDNHCEPHRWA